VKHYQSEVATVPIEASVTAVAEKLRSEAVGSLVVTNGNKPVGIVTDRDLMRRVVAAPEADDTLRAGDVMTSPLVSVSSDQPMEEVVKVMSQRGIRRVPVVDDERLQGIVCLEDLLVQLSGELDDVATGARRGFRDAQRRARAEAITQEVEQGLDDLRRKLEKLGGDARDALLRPIDDLVDRVTGRG
jgi:CBS domain-containing protein